MKFQLQGRRKFSPGTKSKKDDSFCPVARSMIEAHYGGPEPDLDPEVSAKFPRHMRTCLQCQQYAAGFEEQTKQGQS